MFTIAGFYRNVDTAGSLTYITPLADTHLRVEGFNVIVPEELPNIGFVCAGCSSASAVQVEAPSLRRIANLDVYPMAMSTPFVSGYHVMNLFDNPVPLEAGEPLRLQVSETATGAVDIYGVLGFCDGVPTPQTGEWYTIRCTVSGTITANTWSALTITPVQTLPAGRYAVGGLAVYGGNLICARLIFVGLPWRPGVVGDTSASIARDSAFRFGKLGVWGEFRHDQPPSVEVLMTASGALTVYLDVMKL